MKGCSWVLDVITAIFLLLTVAVISFTILLIANPHSSLNPYPPLTPIPRYVLATDLPTSTASPTETPAPASATPTASATATATATATASSTPTASNTPVFSISTPTRAASKSGKTDTPAPPTKTPSGFQFVAKAIRYEPNKTTEGCKWSSIAGNIVDANGAPLSGIAVSVVGGGGTIDETHYSGQERRFGEGGFEVFLGSQPRQDDYTVTVLGKTGAPLSEPVNVQTKTGCTENVAVITFTQTR